MNLFILHKDPVVAAQMYCDIHVRKIILESVDMLGLAHYEYNLSPPTYEAKTHKNNHVSKWVRESIGNYIWTVLHGTALCNEYTYRSGKVHKYEEKMIWFANNIPPIVKIEMTPFRQAVADDCYHDDPVEAYRMYYNKYKRHLFGWTERSSPDWLK